MLDGCLVVTVSDKRSHSAGVPQRSGGAVVRIGRALTDDPPIIIVRVTHPDDEALPT